MKIKVCLFIANVFSLLALFGVTLLIFPRITQDKEGFQNTQQPTVFSCVLEDADMSEDDSLNVTFIATNYNIDSLIIEVNKLIGQNNWLKEQHEKTVSDIRQENNNFINKVNVWLTFWTTVSAILCALFPIIIQYFNMRIERKKMLNHVNSLKKEINDYKRLLDEQQKELCRHKTRQEGLRMLEIGIESTLLDPGNLTQGSYINELWLSVYTQIKEQANDLLKDGILQNLNLRYQLCSLLLYMYGYMNQLQRIIPTYRSRSFNRCQDAIRNLYNSIKNNEFDSESTLKKEFNDTIEFFRQLLQN